MSVIYKPRGRAQEYSHLAINHYRGCGHRCTYCYVPAITHNQQFFYQQSLRKDVIKQLEKEAPKYAGTDKRVLLSFSSDPYQPLDTKEGATRKVLEILKAHDIPFQVLTKGGLRAVRDFDLYGPKDAFAVTFTSMFAARAAETEPKAAIPRDRLEALSIAKERGIHTWVSLEPVLNIFQSLVVIEFSHKDVDLFKIGITNHIDVGITPDQWRDFGIQAISLCKAYNTKYFIKHDLQRYLGDVKFENTDNRIVENMARPGEAWRGKARPGEARQGEARSF